LRAALLTAERRLICNRPREAQAAEMLDAALPRWPHEITIRFCQ
jgi:hypothetical protein